MSSDKKNNIDMYNTFMEKVSLFNKDLIRRKRNRDQKQYIDINFLRECFSTLYGIKKDKDQSYYTKTDKYIEGSCFVDDEPDVRKGIVRNYVYLNCKDPIFKSLIIHLLLLPYRSYTPNISDLIGFEADNLRGSHSTPFLASNDTEKPSAYNLTIQKEKVSEFHMRDILKGDQNFIDRMLRLQKFEDYFGKYKKIPGQIQRMIAENVMLQCISHLNVLEDLFEVNMMVDFKFDTIKIKIDENFDVLKYKTVNSKREWSIKYIGIRVIFDSFGYSFFKFPINVSQIISKEKVVFSHKAGYFFQNLTKAAPNLISELLSTRLKYWDEQIESKQFLPTGNLSMLILQSFYYEYGVYNSINRIYMNIEGTKHDIINGSRDRLYTIQYNKSLYECFFNIVNTWIPSIFTPSYFKQPQLDIELFFRSFLDKGEISYTTSSDMLNEIISLKSGNEGKIIIDMISVNDLLIRKLLNKSLNIEKNGLLDDLVLKTENYGRGRKNVFIPEKILNIRETQELGDQLSKGEFNLKKITNFGDLKNLQGRKCRFCLKDFIPPVCDSDDVTEENCQLQQKESESCTKNTNVAGLKQKDPYWIAGGKQGQVFKGVICKNCENPTKDDITFVAIKKFPQGSTDTICDAREGELLTCSEFLNEVNASLVASDFYNKGKSPHYMKVYSVFKCMDDSKSLAENALSYIVNYDSTITHYFMVMERIHGTLDNIDHLVSTIESGRKELGLKPLGIDVYFHNCIAQVLCILRTFHEQLEGMHLDFHPGNVFLKICDKTLYNGKTICSNDNFVFEFSDGSIYTIPNIGIIAKLGDLGHARIRVPNTNKLIMRQPGVGDLKEVLAQNIGPKLESWGFPGKMFATQFYESSYMRYHDRFDESYDLACLFNRLAVNHVGYNQPSVEKYHAIEKLFHLMYFGNEEHYYYNKLNSVIFFLADLPTAYVPKVTATFVTPQLLLETDIFKIFNTKPPTSSKSAISEVGYFGKTRQDDLILIKDYFGNLGDTGAEEFVQSLVKSSLR